MQKKSQNLNVFLKQPSKHFIAAIVSPAKRHISRRFEFKSWWLYTVYVEQACAHSYRRVSRQTRP
jgi:hypothetical protein